MKLQMVNVTRRFGDFCAVDDLNLAITNGVYGLLGVNGAGKTVLTDFIVTVFDESVVFVDFIASFLIFRIDVVEVDTHSIFLCPVEAIPHPL